MTRFVLLLAVLAAGRGSTSAQEMPQQPAAAGVSSTGHSAAEISELQKKADSGDPEAQYALGNAYQDGNGVRKSYERAAIWYRKAADQGNAKAQNSLGVLYWVGDGVDKDKERAVEWYRKAARQGNANAMFNLGAAYYNGEGVGLNDTSALAWFLLAREAGSDSGKDAVKRAEGEHGPSRFDDAYIAIGQMYEKGDDLPHDTSRAVVWYRKAADRQNGEATLDLAALYVRGREYEPAKQWCDIAAKAHLAGGYYCLGYLFQNGLGVARDSHEAFKWYLSGARAGQVQSMRIVAQKYETGDGVEKDIPAAFAWFLIASHRDDKDSFADARRLGSAMNQKDSKTAKKKLAELGYAPEMVDAILKGDSKVPR